MNYVRNTFFSLALLLLVAPSAFAASTASSSSSSSASSSSLSSGSASSLNVDTQTAQTTPLLNSASGSNASAPAATQEGRLDRLKKWMSGTRANQFRKDHPYITLATGVTTVALGGLVIAYNKSADFKKWVDAKCSSLKAYFNDEKNGKTRKIVAAAVPVGAAAIGGAYLAYKKYKKPAATV